MKTVLIVDDDEFNLELFSALVSDLGYGVILSQDGKDALKKFKESRPDLIITDIYMQNNGIELMSNIKAIDPQFPIVTVSGGVGFDDGEEILRLSEEMGAVYSLKKPIEEDRLESTLRSILD